MVSLINAVTLIGLGALWLRVEALWSRYMSEQADAIRQIKADIATASEGVKTAITEGVAEINSKIKALEDVIAAGGTPADINDAIAELRTGVTDSFAALGTAAQGVKDVVPGETV